MVSVSNHEAWRVKVQPAKKRPERNAEVWGGAIEA